MALTTKTITGWAPEAVRTNEDNGDTYLVILITYSDTTQARIVLPLDTLRPV